MAEKDGDLKAALAAKKSALRLWAGGERAKAIDLAVEAKLPVKEWPEGMAEHKAALNAGN